MKEITLVTTAEITVIEKLDDDELNELLKDTSRTTKMVENELKNTLNADDVHAKVQIFVRDDNND